MGIALTYTPPGPQSVRSGVIRGALTGADGGPAVGNRVVALEQYTYVLGARSETSAAGMYALPHLDKTSRYHVIFEDYDGGVQYDYLNHANITPGG